jgi:hypothetical protein
VLGAAVHDNFAITPKGIASHLVGALGTGYFRFERHVGMIGFQGHPQRRIAEVLHFEGQAMLQGLAGEPDPFAVVAQVGLDQA